MEGQLVDAVVDEDLPHLLKALEGARVEAQQLTVEEEVVLGHLQLEARLVEVAEGGVEPVGKVATRERRLGVLDREHLRDLEQAGQIGAQRRARDDDQRIDDPLVALLQEHRVLDGARELA